MHEIVGAFEIGVMTDTPQAFELEKPPESRDTFWSRLLTFLVPIYACMGQAQSS